MFITVYFTQIWLIMFVLKEQCGDCSVKDKNTLKKKQHWVKSTSIVQLLKKQHSQQSSHHTLPQNQHFLFIQLFLTILHVNKQPLQMTGCFLQNNIMELETGLIMLSGSQSG